MKMSLLLTIRTRLGFNCLQQCTNLHNAETVFDYIKKEHECVNDMISAVQSFS